MKYTIREFAQEIRNNYPNNYDDLSDTELVNLWLKKYPKDKSKVNLNSYGESPIQLKQTGSKPFLSFFSISVILISSVLFFTNPDIEEHYKESNNLFKLLVEDKVSDNVDNNLLSTLGSLLIESVIDENIEQIIYRKNFYLFSITVLRFQNIKHNIGIGILGYVHILAEPDDLRKEIDKFTNNLKYK